MVSQKSMKNIRLSVDRYEQDGKFPDTDTAHQICKRLNWIISNLVETDTEINPREFDIWRGMAAGTQAQGSWGNEKGNREEALIKGLILRRLQAGEYLPAGIKIAKERYLSVRFIDQRLIKFGDEPDVAIYRDNQIQCAVEVKGGIDPAGVLERIGAAIKSLSRAIHENPDARTILLLQGVSVTTQAKNELLANQGVIQHWFTVEEMFDEDDSTERDLFFSLLNI